MSLSEKYKNFLVDLRLYFHRFYAKKEHIYILLRVEFKMGCSAQEISYKKYC